MSPLHKRINQTEYANFRKHFGVTADKFYHPITGFDIIDFERFLKVPDVDGVSIASFITDKYGNEALDIVKKLIS